MSVFKVIVNVKSIGNWNQKIFDFFYIFKGCVVRVLEVFVDNHFYANWKWWNVRQCDSYEGLFSYLLLPSFEGIIFYNFCIFSIDTLIMLVTKRKYMYIFLCIHDCFKDCNDMEYDFVLFWILLMKLSPRENQYSSLR